MSNPILPSPDNPEIIAALVGCSISYQPDLTPPVSSHETLFEAIYAHQRELMLIHMSYADWNNPIENSITGTSSHLHWEEHPQLANLTGIDITNLPVSKSVHIQAIPGQLISENPLTFRITPLSAATHFLSKNLWTYAKLTPDADPLEVELLISNHNEKAEAYADNVRNQHPGVYYFHAINLVMPCGVDYWILPIIK